jgi:hypothetical protein
LSLSARHCSLETCDEAFKMPLRCPSSAQHFVTILDSQTVLKRNTNRVATIRKRDALWQGDTAIPPVALLARRRRRRAGLAAGIEAPRT